MSFTANSQPKKIICLQRIYFHDFQHQFCMQVSFIIPYNLCEFEAILCSHSYYLKILNVAYRLETLFYKNFICPDLCMSVFPLCDFANKPENHERREPRRTGER